MSEIRLVWPNKDLALRASGDTGYKWVQPIDCRLNDPLEFESLTMQPLKTRRNLVVIGDGLDVLEALSTGTTIFRGGIRLVYIDPPFNTQVNFRQYRDTMERSMWLRVDLDLEADRMNPGRLPRSYAEAVTPERALHYLNQHGWERQPDIEPNEIVLFHSPTGPAIGVRFGLTQKYADYLHRLVDVLFAVAEYERRPYWEVYMDVTGRYYVGPHTYSGPPLANGSANGTMKHEVEPAPVA